MKEIDLRLIAIIMTALLLGGCASSSAMREVPINAYTPVAGVDPSLAADQTADLRTYVIAPFDELRIDVFGEPEISLAELPVDPDGTILVPLAGRIGVEGRTQLEVSEEIARRLRRYIRDPQVAVNVTQFTSQKITVAGAVRQPGVFPAMGRLTLMDAIAMGQGVGDYSKKDEVVVFRRNGAQRYAARFDLDMIQAGQAVDPRIESGDIVVVGYSEARRRFADILAVLPAAVGIFIALIPQL